MTIEQAQHTILAEMEGFDNWFDTYDYLIQQGQAFEGAGNGLRSDDNLLPGCQSQVWMSFQLVDGVVEIEADSNAHFTRGILALLHRVLHRQPPDAILEADLFLLDKTGLSTNLSPSRANGLHSILQHIRNEVSRLG